MFLHHSVLSSAKFPRPLVAGMVKATVMATPTNTARRLTAVNLSAVTRPRFYLWGCVMCQGLGSCWCMWLGAIVSNQSCVGVSVGIYSCRNLDMT